MKNITDKNGLVVWNEKEIMYRNFYIDKFIFEIKNSLLKENNAWKFERIESSCLIPTILISPEYSTDDYFNIGDLSLRPETTALSYKYAEKLISDDKVSPPICVYQSGKSFRNELDNVSKNVRLKEFYQLEFQCIYSDGTLNDYYSVLLNETYNIISDIVKLETRIVESDRLPSYSEKTFDIEVKTEHKWLEICSVSLRNDFLTTYRDKKLYVVEVAIGLDRLLSLLNN